MAVTASKYNHTDERVADLSVGDEASNWYVELTDGTTAFNATHTTLAQADDSGADEIDGNGWTTGGENLTSVAATVVNTSYMKITADNVSVTASGGSIAAAAAVVYVDEGGLGTTKTPMVHIDFGETITANDGTPFVITWNASGIIYSTAAA